ncbi:MAG: translation elongation factor Ts [Flavobacteriales bacterium]|nr:elongation factor Ts [Flavobacteriales bacterium]MCB0788003.1 elongation factor Ts [Flavobacteriales bacterium]MCB9201165.1 elongation factor Ts [Flavobacteriales bacterium]HOP43477.1 translation elongation factor Ts [Flavobacteriales bacterium]HPF68405.1 translation elongation factor Ts [Flavobacteriales bacterium]
MAITASDVNKLRQMTGAGMMDCKSALTEANGDFDAAVDILRKKGQKVAAKRADREANEGYVVAKTNADGTRGVLVAVNCETDFVAKNADFVGMAERIVDIALEKGASTIEDLKALPFDQNGLSIAEKLVEQTGVIGEKIDVGTCEAIEATHVYAYNHPGNKVASLVGMSKTGFGDTAKDVAMQVAAMAPVALDKGSTPQSVIDKELEIGKELAIQEGKPAEMAEKIAMGRLNKFFKESTLLAQDFIKDGKMNVEQYVKTADKDLTVTGFKRYSLTI